MGNSIKRPDLVIPPQPVRPGQAAPRSKDPAAKGTRFSEILTKETRKQEGIRFSAHAQKRLESRNIQLNERQHEKLNQAVEKADSKGVKDSLILLDRLALVVNVKNRTVITALDQSQLNGGVVTNIDGALIINDESE